MVSKNSSIDFSVAFLIVGLWTVTNVIRHWGNWDVDMSAIYMAARFVSMAEFSQVYAAPQGFFGLDSPERWTEVQAALGQTRIRPVPYVYPPLWAHLLSPIAGKLDPIAFFDATRIVIYAAYGAAILAAWKLLHPTRLSMAAFAAIGVGIAEITIPAQFSMMLSQPQTLVLLLTILTFERYLAGHYRTAGVLLGLAAAMKITPVLFCLIFLLDRNWRALTACLVVAGTLGLASILIAGPDQHLAYLQSIRLLDSRVPFVGLNTTLEVILFQTFFSIEPFREANGVLLTADNVWWITLAVRSLLLIAIASAVYATKGFEKNDQTRVRIFLFSIAFVFCGPLGWAHYYMFPIIFLPGLLCVFTVSQTLVLSALMVTAFSTPATLLLSVSAGDARVFPMVAGLVLVITYLLVLRFSLLATRAKSRSAAGIAPGIALQVAE